MRVQVAGEIFPSFNSTNGIAVDVYLSGCSREPKCKGCHNPLLWDFNNGKSMEISEVVNILRFKYADADSVAIMGGEPLNQPNITNLLAEIKKALPEKKLWVYTSYEFEEIPEEILQYVDYVKTGRYREDLPTTNKGFRLASSNQKIWGKSKYKEDAYCFVVTHKH